MAVTLQSSRFGELQIPAEAVLDFPSGLIGLGGQRFALLARSEESAFVWLHSMDDPELAIPVTDPWRFFEGYELELSDDEAERIGATGPEDALVYVTVAVTVLSGVDYFFGLRRQLADARTRSDRGLHPPRI